MDFYLTTSASTFPRIKIIWMYDNGINAFTAYLYTEFHSSLFPRFLSIFEKSRLIYTQYHTPSNVMEFSHFIGVNHYKSEGGGGGAYFQLAQIFFQPSACSGIFLQNIKFFN